VIAETEDLREFLEACAAAILEQDAGLPRAEAELEAASIRATWHGTGGYLWGRACDRPSRDTPS
jgi:hypothetical protein